MIIFLLTFIVNLLVLFIVLDGVFTFFPVQSELISQLLHYVALPVTQPMMAVAIALALLLSTTILSYFPFMQRYLCYVNGCRTPSAEEKLLLENIVRKLCDHSGENPNKYNLYIKNDNELNAFAIGTNNICVHRGLLYNFSASEIAGIVAHEMGHIENGDTTYSIGMYAMSSATNMVLSIYLFFVRILSFFMIVPFVGWIIAIFVWFVQIQIFIIQFLLNIPLSLITLFGSRKQEYAADKYAYDIGLGRELYIALSKLKQAYGEKKQGFFSSLWSTHPGTDNRLIKLAGYLGI